MTYCKNCGYEIDLDGAGWGLTYPQKERLVKSLGHSNVYYMKCGDKWNGHAPIDKLDNFVSLYNKLVSI